MDQRTQYFCYVYDAPGKTPHMQALEADSFTEAITETQGLMRDEIGGAPESEVFAEIWDPSGAGEAMTRIEAPPGAGGLLRTLRRGRPFSRSSRP